MRRCRPRPAWLLVAVASFTSTRDAAVSVETQAYRCPGVASAPAGAVAIADCAGLETLPADMTEDANLFFDGARAVVCDKLVTLTVNGGTTLALHLSPTTCRSSDDNNDENNKEGISDSPGSAQILEGVRIVVKEGGKLTVGMAADSWDVESDTAGWGTSTLTLQGAKQQGSSGGALEVKRGGTAVLSVPVHFKGNSVAHGFSGGGLHADGEVTFNHAAHFEGNRVDYGAESEGQEKQSSCGGGVSVGASGRVKFSEFASFEENSAGRGGGLCNRGWVRFFRRSFFNANHAWGGVTMGGDGGAMCAEEGSQTIFARKSTILMNWAAGSGGGIFNAGVAMFETSVTFRGNDAAAGGREVAATAAAAAAAPATTAAGEEGPVETGGGHVFNRGYLRIRGDASFREGFSATDGGAVYTVSGEDTVLGGITSFEGNTADGNCKDLYSALEGSEVKLTTTPITAVIPPAATPPTTLAPGSTAEESSSVAAAATSTPTIQTTTTFTTTTTSTASIGTEQRRRVSRLDSSPDTIDTAANTSRGKNTSTQSDAGSSSGRRTTPCQP